MYKLIFLLLLVPFAVLGQTDQNSVFQQANRAYSEGNFEGAAELYEQLVNNGYESYELYYNLGNSYYRLGKIGLSILNYERALKLEPSNEDVLHNINFVKSRTADRIDEIPSFFLFKWWEGALGLFTINGWTYAAYLLYLLLLISISGYFLFKNSTMQKYSFFSGIFSLMLLLVTVVLLTINLKREANLHYAVIIESVSAVKMSPDYKSTDAFIIHEGTKVFLKDKVENWVNIRIEDGRSGWIPESDLRTI